ncbi:hypothetical protein [Paenibacillus periandrae]|uniref:hypothetical protein n=1 Tax=Paenibacillus periandrae TaxID=1761741 RepID=UPI001F09B107|nr:hypothetical protein [Paenibacillus periandrae]
MMKRALQLAAALLFCFFLGGLLTMGLRMQFDFDTGGLMDIPEIIRDIDCSINT